MVPDLKSGGLFIGILDDIIFGVNLLRREVDLRAGAYGLKFSADILQEVWFCILIVQYVGQLINILLIHYNLSLLDRVFKIHVLIIRLIIVIYRRTIFVLRRRYVMEHRSSLRLL